ncbi:hypothetical protein JW887_06830 [Candidatus Dojkabacteria bacterium]|nr:hypothetical protein [Candidatus Dojkabacteria bacterium]
MKKRVKKYKLNVKKSHSKAQLNNLLLSLLSYAQIKTITGKAKTLKTFAEKEIHFALTLDKESRVNALMRRYGYKKIVDAMSKYIDFIKSDKELPLTGFISSVKVGFRSGDNSELTELKLFKADDYRKSMVEIKKSTSKKITKKKVKSETNKTNTEKTAKDEGFLAKIGNSILGRKNTGPSIQNKQRAKSRSGI